MTTRDSNTLTTLHQSLTRLAQVSDRLTNDEHPMARVLEGELSQLRLVYAHLCLMDLIEVHSL